MAWLLTVCLFGFADGAVHHAHAEGGAFQVAQGVGERLQRINPFRPLMRMLSREPRNERRRSPVRSRPQEGNSVQRVRTAPPVFVEEPKNDDAGVILVAGDQMAKGVASGLRYILADQPNVRVDLAFEDGKGLAGGDALDWPSLILSQIRSADVKAVVFIAGRSDLDEIFRTEEGEIAYATEEWFATFEDKVESIVQTIRRERLPVLLIGLPPTGAERVNETFESINTLLELQTSDSRVRFIELWDVFLNDEGVYSSFGPDVDGKRARLRTKTQIDFTWAGFRKVAFFVERELSRLLGGYGGLAFEGIEDDPNFIVLTGRTTSPEAELLGAQTVTVAPDTESSAYRFFVEGEPLTRVPGRIDGLTTQTSDSN
ncbi:DUF459 domain-containing protein [Roseibium hamelinense]|uniref:SGNH/GDSL hydrolase family protein n=1 Tax=Roseibium hamelinense TaxID=150831 RepID=UPI0011A0E09F|nr:DUF459 domain-containing protein [Roseibium hamelinense]MTI45009.1 DUF459 domain-containing protein [Roseibium hamelinense]